MSMEHKAEMEIVYLHVDILHANNHNPNKQKDIVFNKLVENMQEIGFVEPVMVRPHPEKEDEYEIVSGHHRVEAAKIIGFEEVPCIVQHDFDEDMAKFQLVRMNVLRGELDPMRFTKLFNEMAEKYGDDLTKDMMAMVDMKAFDKLYVDVKKELPPELQKKLENTKKEIKDVDGLSRILNEMFSNFGNTLDYNFMIFKYSDKEQLWIQLTPGTKKLLFDKIVPFVEGRRIDINTYFNVLIDRFGFDEEMISDLEQATSVADEDPVNFS